LAFIRSEHLADGCAFSPITAAPTGAARAQADALLTSHIAPGRRTLAPSRCAASASRMDAMAAEKTSAGWLRSKQLRQLGDISSDPPRLVTSDQLAAARRAAAYCPAVTRLDGL
jgi:hypothetical protein